MIQQFHTQIFIQRKQNTDFKIYIHLNVHSIIIYNKQGMEAVRVHQHMNG